jgi:hypothetical protein
MNRKTNSNRIVSIPLGLWLLWIHIAFKKEPYVKASNIFKVNRAFVPCTLQCQGKLGIFYQLVSLKKLVWQFWTSKGIYIYIYINIKFK